jgi:hypothetical protein
MNERKISEQTMSNALTEDELTLIVGGNTDPNDPVGGATGAADLDLKSTPILM